VVVIEKHGVRLESTTDPGAERPVVSLKSCRKTPATQFSSASNHRQTAKSAKQHIRRPTQRAGAEAQQREALKQGLGSDLGLEDCVRHSASTWMLWHIWYAASPSA
jgi:hypothetical protein